MVSTIYKILLGLHNRTPGLDFSNTCLNRKSCSSRLQMTYNYWNLTSNSWLVIFYNWLFIFWVQSAVRFRSSFWIWIFFDSFVRKIEHHRWTVQNAIEKNYSCSNIYTLSIYRVLRFKTLMSVQKHVLRAIICSTLKNNYQ